MLLAAVLPALFGTASAAEVQLEGFYRARARALDSLSLDRTSGQSEGLAAFAQHRLWLKPRFLLSEQVGLFTEIRGLDNVYWGQQPSDNETFIQPAPFVLEYDLQPPISDSDPSTQLNNLTLWRAWGEVHTDIGRFTFGRVPLHWGLGIWLNDGITVDPAFADNGDTTDRLMWELLVQEQFYVRLAVDIPTERFIGFTDDSTTYNAAAAYRSEDITAGLLVQLDRTGPRAGLEPLSVFTLDGAADISLGPLQAAAEVVGHFGSGALEGGFDEANITAIGAALDAALDADPLRFNVRAGIATGDSTPTADQNIRTYTFDRDFSVGMFMFEHPMPTLATGVNAANPINGGRDYDSVLSGSAISNAIFLKPTVRYQLLDGLSARASWLGARTAQGSSVGGATSNSGYGNEIQLGIDYLGIDHLELDGAFGLFLPGTVYSQIRQDIDQTAPTGYDDPAFGFQLSTRIRF
ncbi:MAG TPA: hypothetical protein ENK18_27075 [Deltaproteobacteria bacterium]|nr:hypothetical protein [Deltaproteobacteria bacterium]